MPKDDLVYVGHMLDMARKVVEKARHLDRSAFDQDENLRLAFAHLIQIIGEAAGRVSTEMRHGHPEIPWTEIIGMRHKIVHDYLEVDEDIVWDVVTADLPPLVSAPERILPFGEQQITREQDPEGPSGRK